jgi:hypothetical protein
VRVSTVSTYGVVDSVVDRRTKSITSNSESRGWGLEVVSPHKVHNKHDKRGVAVMGGDGRAMVAFRPPETRFVARTEAEAIGGL